MKKIRFIKQTPLLASGLAILIGSLVAGWYFANQYQKSSVELLAELGGSESKNRQALVEEVGRLIMLPANEKPAIGAVQYQGQFKDHPILSRAEKGDQLLIYAGQKLVVVYRPKIGKIIAAGLAADLAEKAK